MGFAGDKGTLSQDLLRPSSNKLHNIWTRAEHLVPQFPGCSDHLNSQFAVFELRQYRTVELCS